jgi:hypothetical protein
MRYRIAVGAVLVAMIFPLALAARWWWAATPDGRQLRPRPDALEYAAAAQAIAQGGRYYLQVGPYRARPRYPPGWPMVLACALRLGVAGDELWRVAGVLGAGLACLLALVAAGAVWRLSREQPGRRASAGALAAGLLVGLGWALAPVCVAVGRVALGDEPAALVAGLTVLGAAVGLLGEKPATGWRPAAAFGGASFGLLAGMRPASALLVAPAVLLFAAYGWRAHGSRETLRRAALWACGAAVAPLLIAALLWRSDLSPWRWSGYALWAPRWYADVHTTFNPRYALAGNDDFERGAGGRPIPNLQYYSEVLLGLPGLAPDSYLGLWWPAAGWLAGAALAWRHRRRPPVAAVALAMAAMAVAYLAFYSLYFFPAARFLLAPLALPLLALGVACGLGISRPGLAARLVSSLAGAGVAAAVVAAFLAFRGEPAATAPPERDVRSSVAAWLRQPQGVRMGKLMPFDPVEAQALGLLPPEVAARIGVWGALPPTVQVKRLRAQGIIPDR